TSGHPCSSLLRKKAAHGRPDSLLSGDSMPMTIRRLRCAAFWVVILLAILSRGALSSDYEPAGTPASAAATPAVRLNMVGAYGPWLSEKVLGDGPARLPFRTGK